jgi:hypothetical protein
MAVWRSRTVIGLAPMKSALLFLGFLIACDVIIAGVPDSLSAGYVFTKLTTDIGTGGNGSSSNFSILLKGDGTFSGLSGSFTGVSSAHVTSVSYSEVSDGTYLYRKIDEQNAELELTFQGSESSSGKNTLKFEADDRGTVAEKFIGPMSTFYLRSMASRSPLVNCSNRSFVRAGGSAFTGFVITDRARVVLVRAIGPGLLPFGIAEPLRNPKLKISAPNSPSTFDPANDDWNSTLPHAITNVGTAVGAFPLQTNSKDAAFVGVFGPGALVVEVNSSDSSDAGEVLIEVYMLP